MDMHHNCTRFNASDYSRLIVTPPAIFFPGTVMTDDTQKPEECQQHYSGRCHPPIQLARRRSEFSDLRGGLRLATWNVTTISGIGYQTALTQELHRLQIGDTGVREARISGSGCNSIGDSLLLHSGGTQRRDGFALNPLIINPPLINALQVWITISDRLLQVRLSYRHGHLSVIVACAPTEVAHDKDKDAFYNRFSATIVSTLSHDILAILGDFTTVSGPATVNNGVVGPFGSSDPNNNSDRLLSLRHSRPCNSRLLVL